MSGTRNRIFRDTTIGCKEPGDKITIPAPGSHDNSNHIHLLQVADEDYWCVDLRRAKQRTATLEYKRRPISAQLGEKILLLIAQNRSEFGPSNPGSPLFRTQPRINKKTKHCGLRLNHDSAARAIADFISDTLGCSQYRGARMLRHNMAQRLADMGAPVAIVAEALDHSDLSSVRVYVRAMELCE